MSIQRPDQEIDPCIMEGYSQYLIFTKAISLSRAKMNANSVRKFFNYLGKYYLDIEKQDIIIYLSYLMKSELLKERSLYRHLTAIKKFYEYLMNRGDVLQNPGEGVKVKSCKIHNLTNYEDK